VNNVILIGRLTKDSELRYSTSGVAVCNFTLAVDRDYKNKNGEREADFIPVVVYRQLAELCANYLSKGKQCAVNGRMQTRSYDAKDGSKRYVTEVIADSVKFLSPKSNSSETPDSYGTEVNDQSDIPF
jgi:single-strand DNA-binding protein